MLRITMNKSASGAKKYFCEQYYKEGHGTALNYYSDHNEAIGRWGGKAAELLGLQGDIEKRAFAHLCDNQHPLKPEKLTRRNDTDRTVGYDFTFNASKSVSLAYALGNDDDKRIILASFQQAVKETMTEIERGMQARVRAKGKNENRLTGNLAYGAFTHFTTRPIDGVPDPHLHSHCFVFNATFDEQEKKWKAGQFRQIKQDAPYYEAIFHATLAHRLQQLGYGIQRTKNGFELEGVAKATIEKFSRRTQEIEEYAHAHGITDEKQKSNIGAITREAKRVTITAEKQKTAWRSRLTPEEQAALQSLRQYNAPGQDRNAATLALQHALSHHLERKSVASDKEILATAMKFATGRATANEVREAFASDSSVLSLEENLRHFVTTKEALKEEKQLIQSCLQSRNKFRPIHEHYEPKNPKLNEQQLAAVRHALSSTDGITIITGKAGTGKTTLMKEVQLGIIESGKKIFAFAPSSEASRGVQRSEGFDNADTVAQLILNAKRHTELKQQVIWIDEAGMLSNKDMNRILAIANAQSARVILSGDTRQHTSVERGDALRILQQEGGIRPVTVSKIQRQQQIAYKEAVELLSAGKTEQGFKQLDRMGAIHEISDSGKRVSAIADNYYHATYPGGQQAKEVLVISPTHAEGSAVTQRIRRTLKEKNVLGQEEHLFTVFKNRQLTEAEKQLPECYNAGDVLAFHQHSKNVKAGSRLTVADANERGIFAKDKEGREVTLALCDAKKFTVYEPRPLGMAEGDRLRITANGKDMEGKYLFNGSVFQVKEISEDGHILLSNGSTLPPDFGHFTHGYVSTSHGAQGKTADQIIISQSSATFQTSSMEQFYVAVSRGRHGVSIYTDDKAELLQSVRQSSERGSAMELVAKQQQQTLGRNQPLQPDPPPQKGIANQPSYLTANPYAHGIQTTTRSGPESACR